MNAAQLAGLLRRLDEEAGFHGRQSKTYRVNSIGRMQHTSTEKLLREAAAELRALGSTYSAQLCERFGIHPETGKPIPSPSATVEG